MFDFKKMMAKEKYAVGLNIGVSSVKAVKLKFSKDAAEVVGFTLEQNQFDMESVLKGIMHDFGARRVNISVSGQQAITRYIDFPKMKLEDLKQSIRFEAQKHIPFPVSEVNIDAVILKDLPDNKMKVLLAAVKKDLINQRLRLLRDLGLEVDIVDIDSLALINAFDYSYSQDPAIRSKTIALLNIGSATSNLNILDDGLPALSRDINVGGNNFSQRVADALNIEFKAAEELKLDKDRQKQDNVKAALEPVLAKLGQEVRTSFDYYESRSITSVEKIFVSGGGSLYPGLDALLANMLSIDVERWDPFLKILIAPSLDQEKLKGVAGQMAVAVGLALRA
ncbi:MAG: type IV pilus assembly protein PilM [Candidatus Omnitrophica bacterium]|nr:type IV pilus assembly protein PilM [Candidatus Omnitrophota bacterium]